MPAMENNMSKLDDLQDLIELIRQGSVTPIISNSLRIEEIFLDDDELMALVQKEQKENAPAFYDEVHTIYNQLAKMWADARHYPMSDGYSWARVAQYLQVERKKMTGTEYIKFLKGRLLEISSKKKGYGEKVKQLKEWADDLNFSEIATDLDYPSFPDGEEDPLLLLARLPLPIYITTGYSDFLERALLKAGKTPRRQICFYNGQKTEEISKHLPDPKYNPDSDNPAVYYLFGMEEYKQNLVLSEDDHLDFLMTARSLMGGQDFPSHLSLAFSQSKLLVLGYSLRDWDFRTLFRLILASRPSNNAQQSIAIQFKPMLARLEGKEDYTEKAVEYLSDYFGAQKFDIRWSNTDNFIYDLWNACVKSKVVSP